MVFVYMILDNISCQYAIHILSIAVGFCSCYLSRLKTCFSRDNVIHLNSCASWTAFILELIRGVKLWHLFVNAEMKKHK